MSKVQLPGKPEGTLHRTSEAPFIANGWEITSFCDESDEVYDRARRKHNGRMQTKWWKVAEEAAGGQDGN